MSIEAPIAMPYVERYYTPILHAYKIIKSEAPSLDDETALQMNLKSFNDYIGLDSIKPMLLGYGAVLPLKP